LNFGGGRPNGMGGKSWLQSQLADAWLAANPGKTLAIYSHGGVRIIKSGGDAENLGPVTLPPE